MSERMKYPGEPGDRVEAIVQAGAVEIPYVRGGRGVSVLLVVANPKLREIVWSVLIDGFLIVAPELNWSRLEIAADTWLRELVDGLGLTRPHIIADETHAVAVLDFALSNPHTLDRIALVWQERGVVGTGHRVLTSATSSDTHFLRSFRLSDEAGGSLDERKSLIEFLQ